MSGTMLDAFGTYLCSVAGRIPATTCRKQDSLLIESFVIVRERRFIVMYDSNRRATTKTAQFERAGHHGAPRGGAALAGFRDQVVAVCHRFATNPNQKTATIHILPVNNS